MSKFEQIMDAFKVALTNPSRIVERNTDVPQELESGNLVIIEDGQETAAFTPMGFQSTEHEHQIKIILVCATADPDARDAAYDSLLTAIESALLANPSLGGLIGGMEFRRPDSSVQSQNGTSGIKASALDVSFHYTTNSFLS